MNSRILPSLILTISILFFSGCSQEVETKYVIMPTETKTVVTESKTENNMEQVFKISDFHEKKSQIYLYNLTETYKNGDGSDAIVKLYLPVDAETGLEISDVPYVSFAEVYYFYTDKVLRSEKKDDTITLYNSRSESVIFD